MKIKRKYVYIAAGLILLYFLVHFFFNGKGQPQAQVTITASPVVQQDVTIQLKTIATVEAYSSVEIKSMVTGPLLSTGFKEGDIVEQNQVLFTIDPRSFVASLEEAKANLLRDQATLEKEQIVLQRNEKLVKQGYTSKQDYDNLVANAKAAEATVKADEAAVKNAEVELSYATIRAPITGKTGSIMLKPGSVIKANDTSVLVTIRQINPIYVTFSVPQDKFQPIQANLQKGPLKVKAITNGNQIEEGTLTFVDNTIDAATGTIQLKATFPNEQHRLWPGQYVTVDLPVEQVHNALLIPSLALLTGQNGFYVYVVDNELTVHMRPVVPGDSINNQTIIKKGLALGEKVVTAGQLRLKDGMKVKITNEE